MDGKAHSGRFACVGEISSAERMSETGTGTDHGAMHDSNQKLMTPRNRNSQYNEQNISISDPQWSHARTRQSHHLPVATSRLSPSPRCSNGNRISQKPKLISMCHRSPVANTRPNIPSLHLIRFLIVHQTTKHLIHHPAFANAIDATTASIFTAFRLPVAAGDRKGKIVRLFRDYKYENPTQSLR